MTRKTAHKHNEEYLKQLLEIQNEHQNIMHNIVVNNIEEQEGLIKRLSDEENDVKISFGEKFSDLIASFGGSWIFISLFFFFLFLWMIYNNSLGKLSFDPYPYILLNLILSCLAAIQAPIILMSQNRKESRDRKRAQNDYLINLKAELENRMTNEKLDLFINKQFKELIEIQKIQIDKMNNIENKLNITKVKKK